jgi:hypothetical protein
MLDVRCEKCSARLAVNGLGLFSRCAKCRTGQKVVLFSALGTEPEKGATAEAVVEDNAACINHPDKAATALCDGCGAYVCSLCEIAVEEQQLCPTCFNNRLSDFSTINKKTVLYDAHALSLSFFSILVGPMALILAPIAIGMTLFYWNKVNTPYPRGKWRFVVAFIIALLLFIGWGTWLFEITLGRNL